MRVWDVVGAPSAPTDGGSLPCLCSHPSGTEFGVCVNRGPPGGPREEPSSESVRDFPGDRPPRPGTSKHCWPRALSHSAKASEALWPCDYPPSPPGTLPCGPDNADTAEDSPPPAHTQGRQPPAGPVGAAFPTWGSLEKSGLENSRAGPRGNSHRGQGPIPRGLRPCPEGTNAVLHTSRVHPRLACVSLFLKTLLIPFTDNTALASGIQA